MKKVILSALVITTLFVAGELVVDAQVRTLPPLSAKEQEKVEKEREKNAKKEAKERERSEKQRLKEEEAARAIEVQRRTVSLRALEMFPSDFLDKGLRLARVRLDKIEPYSEGAQTYYLMAISSEGSSTMAFPLNGKVTFFLETDLARGAFKETEGLPDGYSKIVDIWFVMKQLPDPRGPFYAAKVACITFLKWSGQPSTVVGNCSVP